MLLCVGKVGNHPLDRTRSATLERWTDEVSPSANHFELARSFLEQFNEGEKSDAIALLGSWMAEGSWADPLQTADPAQWHDWGKAVDLVSAQSGGQ